MRNNRHHQRREGGIQEISAWHLPVLQVQRAFSFCHYYPYVIYQNPAGQGFYYFRNNHSGINVSYKGNKAIDNFYKQEYFNILFDFIPLCAGNSACFDSSKIFYRSCLDWLGLL